MLRRTLERTALAVALLVPTLVAVSAPPALASTSSPLSGGINGTAYWHADSFVFNQNDGLSGVYGGVFVKPVLETCLQAVQNDSLGTFYYTYAAGQTVTLCAYGVEAYADGFQSSSWNSTTITLRDIGASTNLGSGSIVVNKTNAAATNTTDDGSNTTKVWVSSEVSARLDDGPLDGVTGTARSGADEMYGVVSVHPFAGSDYTVDTRGSFSGAPSGSYPSAQYGKGILDATPGGGIMAGEDPQDSGSTHESEMETDETALGKVMPITRYFGSTWGAPSSNVATVAAHGRVVIYSFSPKNYTYTASHSAWYDIANGTLDSSLTTWLTTLKNDATATGAPGQMLVTISHEPHDNASDWGGAGNCTVNTTTCFGSMLEFRAMQTHLHSLIASLGFSSILKTIYIATDFAATTHGNDGGTNVIGGGDYMYPGDTSKNCNLANTVACVSSNVDYNGYDVYNYYQYIAGGNGSTFHDGTWEPLGDKLNVDDHAHGEGVALLADRLQKQFFIPELGSHPGCQTGDTEEGCAQSGTTHVSPETRDSWFADGITTIETNSTDLKWLRGWVYFHKVATWTWEFVNDSVQTLDTFHQRGTSGWENNVSSNTLFSFAATGL